MGRVRVTGPLWFACVDIVQSPCVAAPFGEFQGQVPVWRSQAASPLQQSSHHDDYIRGPCLDAGHRGLGSAMERCALLFCLHIAHVPCVSPTVSTVRWCSETLPMFVQGGGLLEWL